MNTKSTAEQYEANNLPLMLIFFVLKMSSAYYLCCIFSNALQNTTWIDQKRYAPRLYLFDLILYVPVNNFSVMLGCVFLG